MLRPRTLVSVKISCVYTFIVSMLLAFFFVRHHLVNFYGVYNIIHLIIKLLISDIFPETYRLLVTEKTFSICFLEDEGRLRVDFCTAH